MYGLSVDTDLGPLVGTTITYVGVGQFTTHLAFSGPPDSALTIEGAFTLADAEGASATYTNSIEGGRALLALLGRAITSAAVPTDGTVKITLDNGAIIEVPDESDQYESYQLNLSGRQLIV